MNIKEKKEKKKTNKRDSDLVKSCEWKKLNFFKREDNLHRKQHRNYCPYFLPF